MSSMASINQYMHISHMYSNFTIYGIIKPFSTISPKIKIYKKERLIQLLPWQQPASYKAIARQPTTSKK